jgi:hypothetical protein
MIQMAYYNIVNCFTTKNNQIELNTEFKLNWWKFIFSWSYQDLYLNSLRSNNKKIMKLFKHYLIIGFVLELLIIAGLSIIIFIVSLVIGDKSDRLKSMSSIINITLVIIAISLIIIFSCIFYLRYLQVNRALSRVGSVEISRELSMRRVVYAQSTITLPNYTIACQTPPVYLNESYATSGGIPVATETTRNSEIISDLSPRYEP